MDDCQAIQVSADILLFSRHAESGRPPWPSLEDPEHSLKGGAGQ